MPENTGNDRFVVVNGLRKQSCRSRKRLEHLFDQALEQVDGPKNEGHPEPGGSASPGLLAGGSEVKYSN